MPEIMKRLLYPYMGPAGDDGDAGGGGDRGDDFIPTGEDADKGDSKAADKGDELDPPAKGEKDEDADPDAKKDEDEDPDAPKLKDNEELDENGKPRSKSIPRIRFDKAMEKAKAKEQRYQERIAELEGALKGGTKVVEQSELKKSISELQDKYEDLILDGKKDQARKVREQLEDARERLIEARTTQHSDAAKREAIDELKYDAALAKFESEHGVLNPEHEEFDEEVTNEVAMLMSAFVARGFTRHAALTKAVKYVVGTKPAKVEDVDVLRKAREQEARRKAAEANKRQPSSFAKTGVDSDKAGTKNPGGIDVMKLSQEKFAKLDDETKASLRGDDL